MTLSQLLEEVMGAVELDPNAQRVQRAEATRLMNLAMREISLRVGIPQLSLDVPSTGYVTGAFTLPVQVHASGVKRVELLDLDDGSAAAEALEFQELDTLSPSEALTFHPTYDDPEREWVKRPFLVYTPADRGTGIRPVGITSARYRFLVHAVPPDMSEPTHEPFSVLYCDEDGADVRYPGAMPEYHRILAFHAAYELLQRLNNPSWQAYYARYQAMEQEMFHAHQPIVAYLPSQPDSWRRPRG